MKAIILAGGKGIRLRPLTNSIPKPMTLVNNRPLIEYTVDLFKKFGITDIIFTLFYLPKVIQKHFGTGKKFDINCSYVVENPKTPLGTAGALSHIQSELTKTFIVCSADIIRECNIDKILKFHKKNKGIATICVYKNKKSDPKSLINFDKTDRIIEFIERPKKIPKGIIWSNASLYIFEPKVLKYIPKNKKNDFGKNIFPELLKNNEKIFAYKEKGYFLDIGTPSKLKEAEIDIKKGEINVIN